MTCVEIGLRPDPYMVSNSCDSIEAPLNVCLGSNKNAVPNLKRFQVCKADTAAYPNIVAKSSCESSPHRSAHQPIQLAITVCKPGVLFQKTSWRVTFAEMPRQIHLERRIRFHLLPAVNCRNYPVVLLRDIRH